MSNKYYWQQFGSRSIRLSTIVKIKIKKPGTKLIRPVYLAKFQRLSIKIHNLFETADQFARHPKQQPNCARFEPLIYIRQFKIKQRNVFSARQKTSCSTYFVYVLRCSFFFATIRIHSNAVIDFRVYCPPNVQEVF